MNPTESNSVNIDTLTPGQLNANSAQADTESAAMANAGAISSQANSYYGIIVFALLVLAVLVVYAPRFFNEPVMSGSGEENGLGYVVDLDFWRRTEREKTVTTSARFDLESDLSELPLTVGNWVGQEKPDTNREVEILLDPEQYVRRLYQDGESGQYIWLSVIGGRSSQPFHAPDICYDADGWQYNMGSRGFALPDGGELHGLYLDAQKEMPQTESEIDRHVVSYFYIFPDQERSLSDGIVLFKLTSNRIGSIDESLDLHENFVQNFFTSAN